MVFIFFSLADETSDITIDTFVCEQTMDQYSSNNLIALAPFMNTIIRLHGTWRGLDSLDPCYCVHRRVWSGLQGSLAVAPRWCSRVCRSEDFERYI